MTEKIENNPTVEKLKSKFGADVLKTENFRNQIAVTVKRERILDVMRFLKEDAELSYDYLADMTVVDYLKMEKSPRFEAVYNLRSMKHQRRLRIKSPVPEHDCKIESMSGLWKTADWMEREASEMYGMTFENHPDLRKLLMPETFQHFPLRKDYPLRGKGERDVILPEGS